MTGARGPITDEGAQLGGGGATGRSDPPTGSPDLAVVRASLREGVPVGRSDDDSSRRQWWAALATLQDDLLVDGANDGGLWLASPLPALYEPLVLQRLQGWVWAPERIGGLLGPQAALLPGGSEHSAAEGGDFRRLPLLAADGTDPLLVVITPEVQVGLCLDGTAAERQLVVRFDPAVLTRALALLHERLEASDPREAARFRERMQALGPLHSDPSLGVRFWPRLADRLAAMAPSVTLQPVVPVQPPAGPGQRGDELGLLEALTHEVRTPLATIRTLIRSLLRRSDLSPVVRQRLDQIDSECSEQIDRFGLIFLAAELQRQAPEAEEARERSTELARTDLSALILQLSELWQRQLERRGLRLQLAIGPGLPAVLSDPARLETTLGGLIDRFSRGLPSGSSVRLTLRPAGSRLKLQLNSSASSGEQEPGQRRSVGPVLSWNPDTGSLQLSRQATQRLFRRLGGRLSDRGDQGLTVFFPVC